MASATMDRNGAVSDARIRNIFREEIADCEVSLSGDEWNRINATVQDALQNLPKPAPAPEVKIDLEKVADMVRRTMKPVVKHVEVRLPDGKVRKVEGKTHAAFERAIRLATCRKNILLIGPAGCGKTHLAEQVAKALGLPFSFISVSAGMSEGQLTGKLLPTGKAGRFEYIISQFVERFENGGVFLLDEADAGDANVFMVINAALANDYMPIPNRADKPIARRHPDFVCMAAANTFGTGADRQYVGRNQLDEATLDRFRIGQIEMDYDPDIEAALCPDDALRTRLQGYRAKCRANKLRRLVSMRFLRDAFDMKHAGDTEEEIDTALFAGWSADEIRKVKGV